MVEDRVPSGRDVAWQVIKVGNDKWIPMQKEKIEQNAIIISLRMLSWCCCCFGKIQSYWTFDPQKLLNLHENAMSHVDIIVLLSDYRRHKSMSRVPYTYFIFLVKMCVLEWPSILKIINLPLVTKICVYSKIFYYTSTLKYCKTAHPSSWQHWQDFWW